MSIHIRRIIIEKDPRYLTNLYDCTGIFGKDDSDCNATKLNRKNAIGLSLTNSNEKNRKPTLVLPILAFST